MDLSRHIVHSGIRDFHASSGDPAVVADIVRSLDARSICSRRGSLSLPAYRSRMFGDTPFALRLPSCSALLTGVSLYFFLARQQRRNGAQRVICSVDRRAGGYGSTRDLTEWCWAGRDGHSLLDLRARNERGLLAAVVSLIALAFAPRCTITLLLVIPAGTCRTISNMGGIDRIDIATWFALIIGGSAAFTSASRKEQFAHSRGGYPTCFRRYGNSSVGAGRAILGRPGSRWLAAVALLLPNRRSEQAQRYCPRNWCWDLA